MIKITDELIDSISNKARGSARKRCNYNLHSDYHDPIQRFINAIEPDTYIRPHKHENPDKTEILILLRGRVLILEFDLSGTVADHFILDFETGNKAVEIPPGVWHTFLALGKGSAVYELKEGPFNVDTDKVFAEWAPEEGTAQADAYKMSILRSLRNG